MENVDIWSMATEVLTVWWNYQIFLVICSFWLIRNLFSCTIQYRSLIRCCCCMCDSTNIVYLQNIKAINSNSYSNLHKRRFCIVWRDFSCCIRNFSIDLVWKYKATFSLKFSVLHELWLIWINTASFPIMRLGSIYLYYFLFCCSNHSITFMWILLTSKVLSYYVLIIPHNIQFLCIFISIQTNINNIRRGSRKRKLQKCIWTERTSYINH